MDQHGGEFESVVALAAEVAWERGAPVVSRAHVEYAALAAIGRPVGIAVRIGDFPGPFSESDGTAAFLGDLARTLVSEARAAGCEPAELQIDFDCATSKLKGYGTWVRAIGAAARPCPVAITALPAWLSSADFAPLAREAGGFVLQVHSVDRPRLEDGGATLCDTARARKWVERAAKAGVPFRVALPTYGYVVAYRADGTVAGLIAEQEAPEPAAGTTLRELRADPASLSLLVRGWAADRPAMMQGVIWYRMPVEGDRLNWAWPTLESVMRGETPTSRVRAEVRSAGAVWDVVAVNEGAADGPLPSAVVLRWTGPTLVGADALGGFELAIDTAGEVRLASTRLLAGERVRPGEERALGWIRLSEAAEVRVDAEP